MAMVVKTKNPQGLLDAITKGIEEKIIKTWVYSPQGNFTHTTQQWNEKERGWLVPSIEDSALSFKIGIVNADNLLPKGMYPMYFSAFAEILLYHFSDMFETLTITAKPVVDTPKSKSVDGLLKATLADVLSKQIKK